VLLIRYRRRGKSDPEVGALEGARIRVVDADGIGGLLRHSIEEIRALVTGTGEEIALADVTLLAPVDGRMEVWAAGVTYARSRQARMEESATGDVYSRVYDAERPELFFKALPWRVVTDGEPIAVRRDSPLNVPEAELAAAVTAGGEIAGWTVCNDVSSRSIEGANPLYLPQAKVYAGSCALAAGIRPAWEVDAGALVIDIEVTRDGVATWSGRVGTDQLRRSPAGLVAHLYAEQPFPDGAILSTGTGIVPGMEWSLSDGDIVTISIDGVGRLRNPVTTNGQLPARNACQP
jgi:2-dehydro-3-deoxy-D-arabinonate dehydratase